MFPTKNIFSWLLFSYLGTGCTTQAQPDMSIPAEINQRVQGAMINADKRCSANKGSFSVQNNAVRRFDLTSNGAADLLVIQESLFTCSTGNSIFCDAGGCHMTFITENSNLQVKGIDWELVKSKAGNDVVLISLPKQECENKDLQVCYKALTVHNGYLSWQKS